MSKENSKLTGDEKEGFAAIVSFYRNRKKSRLWKFAFCCVCAIMIFGSSLWTIRTEAQSYRDAVAFFHEYHLSTEGLSKREIKKIYQDITSGKFTYNKTAEIIEKSIVKNRVEGYELLLDDLTPEDVENMWNYMNTSGREWVYDQSLSRSDVSYDYHIVNRWDSKLGHEIFDYGTFEKYVEDELEWSIELKNFYVDSYIVTGENVVICGQWHSDFYIPDHWSEAWVAMIDEDGNILWEKKLENGFENEYITAASVADEEIILFSYGDYTYCCFNRLDLNGNFLGTKKAEKEEVGGWVHDIAKLGEGYIISVRMSYEDSEKILKVDREGNITDEFTYEAEDTIFEIVDMIEYQGNVYLSTCAQKKENVVYAWLEEGAFSHEEFGKDGDLRSNKTFQELVKQQYTAQLLVCDPDSGIPKEFYSAKGAFGCTLSVDDEEKLIWEVESIDESFYSPLTSSFTIGGSGHVCLYTFGEDGTILTQKRTGEVRSFGRH